VDTLIRNRLTKRLPDVGKYVEVLSVPRRLFVIWSSAVIRNRA